MMKSHNRLAVFSFMLILVAAVSMMSYISSIPVNASPSYTLNLKAIGAGYDVKSSSWVYVTMSITGTAQGTLKMMIDFKMKSGDAVFMTYGTFYVMQGFAEIANSCHYIAVVLKIGTKYFTKTSVWLMTGKTVQYGSNLWFSLFSEYAVLPNGKVLKWLWFNGIISPVH